MITLQAALAWARQRVPMREARLLLQHATGRSPAWLEAHRDDSLDDGIQKHFEQWVNRRAAGEPVAYLLGAREFFGREFQVSPAVLIPRPETELLIEWAIPWLRDRPGATVLDLGTGSGCLAITLALECPDAQLTAVDQSIDALAMAANNATRLGAPVAWCQSNWFDAVQADRFDLIVSNPPYIAEGDRHLSEGDLRYEPPAALSSGPEGLDALRCIVAEAPAHLKKGGGLMVEHGYDQAAAVAALFAAAGFSPVSQHADLAGIVRMTAGASAG